jgi:ATP-dependent DNA helicase RecG
MPIPYKGAYWMRAGESLAPMTPDMLKRIFDETGPDFSAEICPEAELSDLDPTAISKFKAAWIRKSGNAALDAHSNGQLLSDAELIVDGKLTFAALILLGSRGALSKYLSQAEVIFEYRSSEVSGPAQQRIEFREGWFLFEEKLLQAINARNDIQHFQDGLFIWDIPTFNIAAIREAVLNAVSHREYRLAGSVFIRQFSRRLEIVSPGGFPPGITADNILSKQSPRNRRVAETLAKCGLVERSGQGVNRMYEECIKESKHLPDFSGTDEYQVSLTLYGEIQDPKFLRFLEKVGKERIASFSTEDMMVLSYIGMQKPVPPSLKKRIDGLFEHKIIEKIGSKKIILSRSYYEFIGQKGEYTRKRGLDRDTNKSLLLKHIEDNQQEGSPLKDLMQVLPSLTPPQVQTLLRELRREGKVYPVGLTRAGRWFIKPIENQNANELHLDVKQELK